MSLQMIGKKSTATLNMKKIILKKWQYKPISLCQFVISFKVGIKILWVFFNTSVVYCVSEDVRVIQSSCAFI